MIIHFGLALDGSSFLEIPNENEAVVGELICGPNRLLAQLELRLGLSGAWEPSPYRTELYRQKLFGADNESRFYHRSLTADSLAVAETLICWRDALRLGGWDFTTEIGTPPRLKDFSDVEGIDSGAIPPIPIGFADRVRTVIARLPSSRLCIATIQLTEARSTMVPPWDSLFDLLVESGVAISDPPTPTADARGDLGALQEALLSGGTAKAAGDGSLVILRTESDSMAADVLVQWFASDVGAKRLLILPPGDQLVSRVLATHGQPAPGTKTYSSQRPVLQILPLLFELIWDPINPYRLLEFLTLPVSPIPRWVAGPLSEAVAKAPGIGGPVWKNTLSNIEEIAKSRRTPGGSSPSTSGIRELVRKWLESPRYSVTGGVPREAAFELAKRIAQWAGSRSSEDEEAERQIKSLAAQAGHLARIVDVLPETIIAMPLLQRLIRMVQGEGQSFGEEGQAGHLAWVASPEAVIGPTEELVWWGFTDKNAPPIPRAPWSHAEKEYLRERGVHLEETVRIGKRFSAGYQRAVFAARNRLVLVIPKREKGEESNLHPFYNRLKAIFNDDLRKVEIPVAEWLSGHGVLPKLPTTRIDLRSVPIPRRIWQLGGGHSITTREEESFSSLDSLFHAPFKWVLNYKARLREVPIISVSDGNALMGNLLHKLFQVIFLPGETFNSVRRAEMERKVDEEMERLLAEEGAVLLLPGREAERMNLRRKGKEAVWTMVEHVRENGWRVIGTECPVKGTLKNQALGGSIDLVLEREDGFRAVVDMKWGGRNYRRDELAKNRAVQLAIYARMLKEKGAWPHYAYYILSDAVLLAPDRNAFRGAYVIEPPERGTQEILWQLVEATWEWRRSQLDRGLIEVPVEGTETDPDNPIPEGCLVAKEDTCKPDEYKVLVGWTEGDHA